MQKPQQWTSNRLVRPDRFTIGLLGGRGAD